MSFDSNNCEGVILTVNPSTIVRFFMMQLNVHRITKFPDVGKCRLYVETLALTHISVYNRCKYNTLFLMFVDGKCVSKLT